MSSQQHTSTTSVSLSRIFSSCRSFTPFSGVLSNLSNNSDSININGGQKPSFPTTSAAATKSLVLNTDDGTWSVRSFYLDSSGRSSFVLPLQLTFPSKHDVNHLVKSGCIQPLPMKQPDNSADGANKCEEDEGEEKSEKVSMSSSSLSSSSSSLKFEVKSDPNSSTTSTKIITVEGIKILSSIVEGNSILFETEIIVRASTPPSNSGRRRTKSSFRSSFGAPVDFSRDIQGPPPVPPLSHEDSEEHYTDNDGSLSSLPMVGIRLEITAILSEKKKTSKKQQRIAPGLLALEKGGEALFHSNKDSSSCSVGPSLTALSPVISLNLSITHALAISVKNVSGPSSGSTLVSITIKHSNTHSEPVTVTNIALHPGHSRHTDYSLLSGGGNNHKGNNQDRSMPGGQHSVTDMSKFVQWGFAAATEPKLPLTLKPHDAYSTVLTIDAGEDLRSRLFVSPLSVTALVGTVAEGEDATITKKNKDDRRHLIVASTDAHWITGRVAVEPADAFRIDMSLKQSMCFVGAPLVVTLRVLNLSTDARDLMLLMAKDDDKVNNNPLALLQAQRRSKQYHPQYQQQQQTGSVNTAVVSEVNGYTFGVWGLSGDDDGTTRHNRDQELLAVDAALLLGEVKGQHAVDAELRFVPLREGTLDVPNLKLYDKTNGKWYNCIHMLKIVAAAKQS